MVLNIKELKFVKKLFDATEKENLYGTERELFKKLKRKTHST